MDPTLNKLELAIFDLDGTLVDSNEAISLCFNLALEEMGHPVRPIQEVAKLIGIPLHDMFAGFIPTEDVDEAVSRYRKYYRTICIQKTVLFPDVHELLEFMHTQDIKLAVATNKPLGFTQDILKSTGISDYFEMTVGPDDVQFPKPDPAMLHLVIQRMKAERSHTVYIGDSVTDCRTAKQAGVSMLAVTTGAHTRQELAQESPDWIGHSLNQLLAYLKSIKEGSIWQQNE